MNPQQTQQMKPDEIAASLAFATNLQDQMVQHQNPVQAPQEAPMAPQQEQPKESPKSAPIDTGALKDEIMKDVKDAIKEQMTTLREEIKSALTDEDAKEN